MHGTDGFADKIALFFGLAAGFVSRPRPVLAVLRAAPKLAIRLDARLAIPPLLLLVNGHRLDNASSDSDGYVTMTRLVEGRLFTAGRNWDGTRL